METMCYFFISINFFSLGQGTDQNAKKMLLDYIHQFEQRGQIRYEVLYWGKEGEQVYYIDLTGLSQNDQVEFAESTEKMFAKNWKTVRVQYNLYYNYLDNKLTFGIIPFGINKKRETEMLNYIEQYEKDNSVKINAGSVINETMIEEDQDKRYMLDLSKLTEVKKRIEFIEHSKNLLSFKQGNKKK
jgi:hypothetical protein